MFLSGKPAKFRPLDKLRWHKDSGHVTAEGGSGRQMNWHSRRVEPEKAWVNCKTHTEFVLFAKTIACVINLTVVFTGSDGGAIAVFQKY